MLLRGGVGTDSSRGTGIVEVPQLGLDVASGAVTMEYGLRDDLVEAVLDSFAIAVYKHLFDFDVDDAVRSVKGLSDSLKTRNRSPGEMT